MKNVARTIEYTTNLAPSGDNDTAHGYTFAAWLAATGRSDSASEYDLRAAWRAGESPADYVLRF